MDKQKKDNKVQETVKATVEREKQIWKQLNQMVADAVAARKEEKVS